MKKIFAILLCGGCAVGLNSCFMEDEDVFNDTSAVRSNNTIESYAELLPSAPNGWVMEYFVGDAYPGYPMLVKFDKDMNVTIAAKGTPTADDYTEESSTYDLITDQGPVLTFDTYNSLIHVFADPYLPEFQLNGIGYGGDYEFVIVESGDGYVRMKGKKYGLEIYLYQLPADQPWDTYYDKIDEIKAQMFNSLVPELYFTAGGEKYTVSGMSDGVFQFLIEGGDPLSQVISSAFVVRLDGTIHLCTPFTGLNDKFSVREFKFSEDGSALNCIDEGQSAAITAPDAVTIFTDQSSEWQIDASTFTGNFVNLYQAVVNDTRTAIGSAFSYFGFTYSAADGYAVITHNGRARGLYYSENAVVDDSTVSVTLTGETDRNAQNDAGRIPSIKAFVDYLASSQYTVTVEGNRIMPIRLKFTSKVNPDDSFMVDKTK